MESHSVGYVVRCAGLDIRNIGTSYLISFRRILAGYTNLLGHRQPPAVLEQTEAETSPVSSSSTGPTWLLNLQCSGYFVQPVSMIFRHEAPSLMTRIAAMDGIPGRGRISRKDILSQREMQGQGRKLRLGWSKMQLWRMGHSCAYSSSYTSLDILKVQKQGFCIHRTKVDEIG